MKNENNESFNFGVKDGVRGFFTNPSRADDSFVPFKRVPKIIEFLIDFPGDYAMTVTLDISPFYNDYKNITVDNILLCLPQDKVWVHGNGFAYTYHYTYDNQKGVITISGKGMYQSAFSQIDKVKSYINVVII